MLWLDPLVLLSVVWVGGEMLLIALRRPTEMDAKKADRGSFGLLMIVMYSAVGAGVWMGMSRIGRLPEPLFLPLHYAGTVLIAAGLVIRWTAIRTLGRFFTVIRAHGTNAWGGVASEGSDPREQGVLLAEKFLTAWNSQDVERVVACYTGDVTYLDPNTRGPVQGADALRRYP